MLNKDVWEAVYTSRLSAQDRRSIIRSSMFIKRKNHPDGTFDKLKARLVAGGDQQDKSLYEDLASPTVSTSAVFAMMGIAAHEKRHTAVVDVSGAFLNAKMTKGTRVYMRLDSTMTDFIVGLDEKYEKFVDPRGSLTVVLRRALYGCVQSAALWHADLCATMSKLGYTRNIIDNCVFNRVNSKGVQCTVCVHVDDLFISSACAAMIADLREGLTKAYGEVSMVQGPTLDYLGMTIDMSTKGEARITMKGYVEDVLLSAGGRGTAATPATEGLFDVREEADTVSEEVRTWFHCIVAKLLYLAKRVRPECLTAVSYLATRVTKCDADDVEKLVRLVKYIRGTSELGLVLRPGVAGITVRLFVDASYGVHMDGRSHTGSCIVIGDVGAVHCRSVKQAIVSKSSTEAELIGMSDSANQGIYMRNFLIGQGYKMRPVTIYQDNMSCMALADRGRSGAERTRHISIKYFWIKERMTMGLVRLEHKGTKEMYANVLTKPLQGSQFIYERECLTGWVGSTSTVENE
jgi:Reverse transcriptase (RNA-dependent DNA polymerase)